MKQRDFGYKFRPVFTVQPFFFGVPLSVCGRFCSRSDVGLSEGFRSSLSLSSVLLALCLSVCLFLSLSEQLGHHICPGLGLACRRCTSCWTWVKIGRKCLPFQIYFFLHTDSSWWYEGTVNVAGRLTSFTTVVELCKTPPPKNLRFFFQNSFGPA